MFAVLDQFANECRGRPVCRPRLDHQVSGADTQVCPYRHMKSALVLLAIMVWPVMIQAATSDEAVVRGVIEQAFNDLKSEQYGVLYDMLPAASRARITRERFTTALQRTRRMYELDRLEIGAVRVSGDIAMAETVMYGRVRQPIESEGKIVARQYLFREEGKWRITTGATSTVQRLLAANPKFARQFPARPPRVYIKREDRWIDVSSLRSQRKAR